MNLPFIPTHTLVIDCVAVCQVSAIPVEKHSFGNISAIDKPSKTIEPGVDYELFTELSWNAPEEFPEYYLFEAVFCIKNGQLFALLPDYAPVEYWELKEIK